MKKLCYWLLVLTLIASVGVLFYENQRVNDRLTVLAEDIRVLSKQTEDAHSILSNQIDGVDDRLNVIENNWLRLFGPVPADGDEVAKPTEPYDDQYADDERYAGFYGRLYIPDAEIDVALYCGIEQRITDRADSANLFTWRHYTGRTIADHCNQEFAKLFSVDIGTMGYIRLKDGEIINIKCVDVFDGYNGGTAGITDKSGRCIMSDADYVMYTCRNGWQNVRIWLWNIV